MPADLDPIAAVTHPDPYPYYARLVAETPLYREERPIAIAAAGVHKLRAAGVEPAALSPPVGYRRSVNVRMALWGAP